VFPAEIVPEMGQLGLLGTHLSGYGCPGRSAVDYGLAALELEAGDSGLRTFVSVQGSLAMSAIHKFGSEAQKQRWLPGMASGELIGCFGLTEPTAGSDPASMQTTARKHGDGWVINGAKNFITHAIHADTCVAFASNDRAKRSKGITGFIFEKGMPGFSPSKKENKLGLRASETASVIFEDCVVPDENRVGDEGMGFVNAMEILDGGRISIAALAVGIAQGAYESAVRYSGERQQFGKPIREFQAIQFKLADMATQIDAARLLMYRAAWMKDQGKKTTRESSMAKLFASEISVRVCEEAVQIHGGYGYTKDYPAEKYWRDSKLCTIGEGTSEIQRMIIAREILKQA